MTLASILLLKPETHESSCVILGTLVHSASQLPYSLARVLQQLPNTFVFTQPTVHQPAPSPHPYCSNFTFSCFTPPPRHPRAHPTRATPDLSVIRCLLPAQEPRHATLSTLHALPAPQREHPLSFYLFVAAACKLFFVAALGRLLL